MINKQAAWPVLARILAATVKNPKLTTPLIKSDAFRNVLQRAGSASSSGRITPSAVGDATLLSRPEIKNLLHRVSRQTLPSGKLSPASKTVEQALRNQLGSTGGPGGVLKEYGKRGAIGTAVGVGGYQGAKRGLEAAYSEDAPGVNPALMDRIVSMGEDTGIDYGKAEPTETPPESKPDYTTTTTNPVNKKLMALYALLGGSGGVLASRAYGHLAPKKRGKPRQSWKRDLAMGTGGALGGAAIGASLPNPDGDILITSKEAAEEARLDGFYHGYKRD
jgi:hypothetical protein